MHLAQMGALSTAIIPVFNIGRSHVNEYNVPLLSHSLDASASVLKAGKIHSTYLKKYSPDTPKRGLVEA